MKQKMKAVTKERLGVGYGATSWKKRWCAVQGSSLVLYKAAEAAALGGRPKGVLELFGATLRDNLGAKEGTCSQQVGPTQKRLSLLGRRACHFLASVSGLDPPRRATDTRLERSSASRCTWAAAVASATSPATTTTRSKGGCVTSSAPSPACRGCHHRVSRGVSILEALHFD
eukprot:COSAG01_NODE_8210_length_2874_cov_1.873514_3_plen_172_part_00